jgi:hypothetical protein
MGSQGTTFTTLKPTDWLNPIRIFSSLELKTKRQGATLGIMGDAAGADTTGKACGSRTADLILRSNLVHDVTPFGGVVFAPIKPD